MPKGKPTKSSEGAKKVGKFGIVGILNTLLDFAILNILSAPGGGFSVIGANYISTSVAMVFSFFANRQVVFKSHTGSISKQALLFFPVTAFGLYIIQAGIIIFLLDIWTWPVGFAYAIVDVIGLDAIPLFTPEFVHKNAAKVVGTVASLTWNFLMYDRVIFKGKK